MEEEEDRPAEGMNNAAASMAGGEESRRRNPIRRFWPPFDMRPAPHERETRHELTKVENGGGVGSETAWSSGRQTASNCKDSAMVYKQDEREKEGKQCSVTSKKQREARHELTVSIKRRKR
jgi:hypothetical protein